jgi:hypothetical protein
LAGDCPCSSRSLHAGGPRWAVISLQFTQHLAKVTKNIRDCTDLMTVYFLRDFLSQAAAVQSPREPVRAISDDLNLAFEMPA